MAGALFLAVLGGALAFATTQEAQAANAGGPAANPTERFTDPFAYCRGVGTIDAPDARWAGAAVPPSIASGLRTAFGLAPEAPLEPFLQGTSWRCMDGAVYACTVGANLPCAEKADTSRTPTSAMADFCRDSPDADAIPAYVTGRATVYAWRCRSGKAIVERTVDAPDARGFIAGLWHRIESAPTSSGTPTSSGGAED